jgi:hypothetical protein
MSNGPKQRGVNNISHKYNEFRVNEDILTNTQQQQCQLKTHEELSCVASVKKPEKKTFFFTIPYTHFCKIRRE